MLTFLIPNHSLLWEAEPTPARPSAFLGTSSYREVANGSGFMGEVGQQLNSDPALLSVHGIAIAVALLS